MKYKPITIYPDENRHFEIPEGFIFVRADSKWNYIQGLVPIVST